MWLRQTCFADVACVVSASSETTLSVVPPAFSCSPPDLSNATLTLCLFLARPLASCFVQGSDSDDSDVEDRQVDDGPAPSRLVEDDRDDEIPVGGTAEGQDDMEVDDGSSSLRLCSVPEFLRTHSRHINRHP